MPLFSKVFKGKDARAKAHAAVPANDGPQKESWTDAWTRKTVQPEEVQQLLAFATQEMKSRALDTPFLILPFRPYADPNAAKTFIRNFFKTSANPSTEAQIQASISELKLTDPMAIGSIMKWCWSRLSGGVVTWPAYELFRVGEKESAMSRQAFDDFIPISVDSEARKKIIFDFFDLLASIAANAKNNGLGGRKLSRLAGWWAFEHSDSGKGFDGGYTSWAMAADATSHLFFAYLRSRTPDPHYNTTGISQLPRSLEALVSQTEYPPETPTLLLSSAPKVVMIVDRVSPTPFALIGRTKTFQYRENDKVLQKYSSYEDPLEALTPECRRVLHCISSTNQSPSKAVPELPSSSPTDSSWTRFEDLGFSSVLDGKDANNDGSAPRISRTSASDNIRTSMSSPNNDYGRPTTPSWADFMSSGFADDPTGRGPPSLLLPPDQILPPIGGDASRASSSPSDGAANLDPGELANVHQIDVDETFWWVWMTSLAGEEPAARKAVFGRCAFIETEIVGGRWLVMEEQVKGAAAPPVQGAYLAQTKRSRFTLSMRNRSRRQSLAKKDSFPNGLPDKQNGASQSRTTVASSEKQAKVVAVAAAIVQKKKDEDEESRVGSPASRRARVGETDPSKTNSTMTMQPGIMKEAAPAMQWARKFDKETLRAKYLGEDLGPGKTSPSPEASGANSRGPSVDAPAAKTDTTITDTPPAALDKAPEAPVENKPEATAVDKAETQGLTTAPVANTDASQPANIVSNASTPASPTGKTKKRGDSVNSITQDDLNYTNRKPTPVKKEKPVMEKAHPALRQNNNKAVSQASAGAAAAAALAASRTLSQKNTNPEPAPRKQSNAKGGLKKLFGGKNKNDSEKSSDSSKVSATSSKGSQRVPLDQKSSLLRPNKQNTSPAGEELTSIPYSATVEAENQPKMQGSDVGAPGPAILASGEEVDGSERVDGQGQAAAGAHEDDERVELPAQVPAELSATNGKESMEKVSGQISQPVESHAGDSSTVMTNESPIGYKDDITSVASPPSDQFQTRAARLLYNDAANSETQESEANVEEAPQVEAKDEIPAAEEHPGYREVTEEGVVLTKKTSQDRWNQIKQSAQQRVSLDQDSSQRPIQNDKYHLEREDDGDTSGEETIEDRVARIKARVAELTGVSDSANTE